MRTLSFLLKKEFLQIFRNKSILALIMVMPVIQLMVLPWAADYEVKNIQLAVVDHDHSAFSQLLIAQIIASGYFQLQDAPDAYREALTLVESDQADLLLEIPNGFERHLARDQAEKVFIAVNAINGTKAGLGAAYLVNIVNDFNRQVMIDLTDVAAGTSIGTIDIRSSNWFNASMNYKVFMVPGILAILVTMVGGFLSALNIVKEKEVGTIEQINVTPIRKHHFILGKLLPFWILGNVVFSIGLLISWLIYGIIPAGNLLLLYGFIALYMFTVLGFGLLVSTYSETQQQAMFIMFFFLMVFILMGGLFTPIESMPRWAQTITIFNPLKYLIEVMRMVILKGSGWKDLLPNAGSIAVFGLVLNTWAILNYRKTV